MNSVEDDTVKNIFTDHPNSIGETYWQHFWFAARFGASMAVGGLACLIHAVFPFVFKKTGSSILLSMSYDVISRMQQIEKPVVSLGELIDRKTSRVKEPA